MIDMHVGDNQRLDMIDGKRDFKLIGFTAITGDFCALKKTTVNQNRLLFITVRLPLKLMTGTGDTINSTMMDNLNINSFVPA